MKLDHKIGRSLKKASPTILTCIGAAGVVATAVLAVKATPKADSLIKADSRKNHDGDPYAATKLEAVKSCWKCYIPAAATGVATIICIFGANTLNKKQQASLASAYALVNQSYSDYKHKLKELYGEDAHKKIMESIAAEKSSMPPITATGGFSNSSLEFEDANEEQRLFYDSFSKRYFQATISQVLQAEYSYIGRYHCASGYKSTTGAAQQVNITRSQARTGIHNLGANFWQMDFAQFWYVNMLFLVEFADWNGERIGRGCSTSNSKMNNGQTDAMGYHTGTTAASRDSYGFTQYRNIEGWWDNVYDWMDGCYYNNNGLNVISNPNNFSDSANGTLVGTPSSGYPSDFTIPTASGLEWALFPSAANGSQTTYVPDSWDFSGGSPCLYHGGVYSQSQFHGPFYVYCNSTSYSNGVIGCRLQERPPKAA